MFMKSIERVLDGFKDQISEVELKEGRDRAIIKLFNGGEIVIRGKENVTYVRKNCSAD